MAALEPGDPRRIGRYRLLGRLGEGGMGRVYLGASPAGRAVAIKVVRPELADDPAFRARFRAEVEAARKVSGAFTSPVVDADPDGTVPWLATAYVNGLSLKETIDRYGPLAEPPLRSLGAGLGEALIAVHAAGLVHRDLKPGNILLARDGPKIIDFGISRAADGTRLTAAGQFVGSPGYMSPAQIRGEDLGPSDDVFAFGAVLAFAATGRPPYGTGSVQARLHRTLHRPPDLEGVPPSLAALVAACLSGDPARRPPATLLPRLLAAPPLAPGWLPDGMDRRLQEHERTLVMDLKAVSRAATRRRLLQGGAAVAGLAVVGGGTAAALAAGDPGGTVPPPRFLWRTTLPTRGDITLARVFPRTVAVFGAFTKKAVAYDTATGRRLWSDKTNNATADEALIYTQPSRGAELVAMDPASRAHRWSAALPSGYNVRELYGPTGGLLGLSDGEGTVIGIDTRTGRLLWKHRAPATAELRGFLNGSLIAASSTTVSALDAKTGAARWERPHSTSGVIVPKSGDLLFIGSARNSLDAVSSSTGRTVWTARLPAGAGDLRRGTPTVTAANGTTYVGAASLYALESATGRLKWAYEPSLPGGEDRTFLVNGRHAYILDNHKLIALDARTGRRLWTADTPGDDTAPLIAAGGLVCTGVAGITDPGLYGWDEATGTLKWRYPLATSSSTDQWLLTSTASTLVALQNETLAAFRLP